MTISAALAINVGERNATRLQNKAVKICTQQITSYLEFSEIVVTPISTVPVLDIEQ